jgi:hypothetical protein
MIIIDSFIENKENSYTDVFNSLQSFGFVLGGNWDYDHGCFDKSLDEKQMVWLRIPFQVVSGDLEGETLSTNTVVKLGAPFVLHHIYNEGLDATAKVRVLGALVDQFQEVLDEDAPVDEKWVKQASHLMNEIEQKWVSFIQK